MHIITDLEDRALYAPLRSLSRRDELSRALDPEIEPWNTPHLTIVMPRLATPAVSDDGADQDTLPKPAMGLSGGAAWVLYCAGILAAMLGVHGWLSGWFK